MARRLGHGSERRDRAGPVASRQAGSRQSERRADVGPVYRPDKPEVAAGRRESALGLGGESQRELGCELARQLIVNRAERIGGHGRITDSETTEAVGPGDPPVGWVIRGQFSQYR